VRAGIVTRRGRAVRTGIATGDLVAQ